MVTRLYAVVVIVALTLLGCTGQPVFQDVSTVIETMTAEPQSPTPSAVIATSVTQAAQPTQQVTPAATTPVPATASPATSAVLLTPIPSATPVTKAPAPDISATLTIAPTASATVTASPTPTASTTATNTPAPAVTSAPNTLPQIRLAAGKRLQAIGDCAAARLEFAAILEAAQPTPSGGTPASGALTPALLSEARYHMAQCYLRDKAASEATLVLQDLLAGAPLSDTLRAPATFLLAEAHRSLQQWAVAETGYQSYLSMAPELSSLTWQRIADVRQGAGNMPGATLAYSTALNTSPDWTNTVAIRRGMASIALAQRDGPAAAAQFDALRGQLTEGRLAAEMQFLAGAALNQTGNKAAAIPRWQAAAIADPTTSFAHQAVIALLDADVPVDEYMRGLINYHNDVYKLAIDAFDRYRATDATGKNGLAWYYTGLSYLALGERERGLAELGNFIAAYPDSPLWAEAWLARARALGQGGDVAGAVDAYRQLADLRPQAPQAPRGLYQAASLLAKAGNTEDAAQTYLALGRHYPAADDGWRAYLTAGLSYFRAGNWRRAAEVWNEMGSAGLPDWTRPVAYYWLGRAQAAAGETEAAAKSWQTAWQSDTSSYYGLRAADWSALVRRPVRMPTLAPSVTPAVPQWDPNLSLAAWLQNWAGPGSLALPAAVLQDPDWQRGKTLLELGLGSPAIAAWERVLGRHNQDAWTLGALATAFRDAGAYRLSISAAEQLLAKSPGADLASAPLAAQRLAYPLSYEELIREQAARWSVDPLLVASVIRQESRFEVNAISVAAAQGLMQVIPSTAQWIAEQLGQRDFRPEEIYWPYVNVTYGTYYLSRALGDFSNNIPTALAGYNGGPGNAAGWRKQAPGDDDLMVALIDYNETRLYVQLVWTNYVTYRRIYGR